MEIETLQSVINNFINDYQINPIKYFYEEDVRADLLIKLIAENSFNIKLPITAKNEWLREYVTIFDEEINISGIKTEYPSTTRFDIAYINPKGIIPASFSNHYMLECLFAVEVKLSQKDNKNSDFKTDIKKLFNYKRLFPTFTGIAINFEQNPKYNIENIYRDYNNYDNLKLEDLGENILLAENEINYFFISKEFILGGRLNAT